MKRVPVYLLALAAITGGAAHAQTISYVLVPTVSPGVTQVKVEMLRSDLTLTDVQATFAPDGSSALDATPQTLKVFVGPSTSRPNPLLNISALAPTGGMVILEPVAGLSTVEVSMEIEQNPVRTAWKLPLLGQDDFFPAHSIIYVLNMVKAADASSILQIFNPGSLESTCAAQVLRPKGSVLYTRTNIKVPAQGATAVGDLMSHVPAPTAAGVTVAVSCDAPFYALGSYPSTTRQDTQVEYPVTEPPGPTTAVVLDSRPGTFFHVTEGDSDLQEQLALDPNTTYHTISINFDVAVVDPQAFVVFRNLIGCFRKGGRRFGKTLYFGSFENFGKKKIVVDVGTPFIETTIKRTNTPLEGGHTYHFSITLNNDQQSNHYVITSEDGTGVMDILGGLYNPVGVVDGNIPTIEIGLKGIADHAYFPPLGWRFMNLSIVATK
jgi:hypothetical protein